MINLGTTRPLNPVMGVSPNMGRPVAQMPQIGVDQGVYRINRSWEAYPIPRTSVVTLTSATGASAVAKTFYLFQESTFNATPTNNGSGAASITVTYDDGFSGASINRLLMESNNGRGLLCKGFTLNYKVTSGGAADPTGLATSAIQLRSYNSKNGGYIPYDIDVAEAVRNNAYNSGIITVETEFWMNGLTQFTGSLPVGDTVQVTFMWDIGN